MSICQEPIHLNLMGQMMLTASTSFVINGLIHPLSTAKNCRMAGQPMPTHLPGLYRGFIAVCGVDFAAFAVSYSTHDLFRSMFSSFAAATLAGVCSSLPISVGEGLMINRQVNNLSYLQSTRKAMRFSGLMATILREVPFNVGVFVLSPLLQSKLSMTNDVVAQGVAGSIAGMVAGFFTTPFDRMKTIIQSEQESLSIRESVRYLTAKRGVSGLFTGGMIRTVYTALTISIINVMYQTTSYFPKTLTKKNN